VNEGAAMVAQLDTREPEAIFPEPMRLELEIVGLPASATSVGLGASCGAALADEVTSMFTVLHYGCPGHDEVELLLVAVDDLYAAQGFFRLPPTSFAPGTTASFAVGADDFVPAAPITLAFTGIPTFGNVMMGASGGTLLRDGQWLEAGGAYLMHPPESGTLDLQLAPDANLGRAWINPSPNSTSRSRIEITWRADALEPAPPISPPSGLFEPYAAAVSLEGDARRPVLTCAMAPGSSGDGASLELRWYTPGASTHRWTHYAPYGVFDAISGTWKLQTPDLPEDKAAFKIGAASQLDIVRCANVDASHAPAIETFGAPLPAGGVLRTTMIDVEL
jgi:hypothetical protein